MYLTINTAGSQTKWLLNRWFETSERPQKVHLKWKSALNHDLNQELTFRD